MYCIYIYIYIICNYKNIYSDMPMAICGLFFGLVISSNFRIRIFPPEASTKPRETSIFSSMFREHPKKNTRIFETMGKKTHLYHPTWRKKNMQSLYLCEPKLSGNFWLTTREIKSPTKKKNPPSTVHLHGFSPQRTPTSLGPLKGTASVRP